MIENYYETICPCCGQTIKIYQKSDGSIAVRFFDIQDQAEIIKILKNKNIELGCNACGKEDKHNG